MLAVNEKSRLEAVVVGSSK